MRMFVNNAIKSCLADTGCSAKSPREGAWWSPWQTLPHTIMPHRNWRLRLGEASHLEAEVSEEAPLHGPQASPGGGESNGAADPPTRQTRVGPEEAQGGPARPRAWAGLRLWRAAPGGLERTACT
jgi:hypothetical protein